MIRLPSRWDINSLLNGGLLMLLLIAFATLVYLGVVLVAMAVGALEGPLKGQEVSLPWWLNLIALACIVILVLPVAGWLRGHVDDLVYGQHDNPYGLLARVNSQLQAMTRPQLTLPTLAETIAQELRLPYVAIETADHDPPVGYASGELLTSTHLHRVPIVYLEHTMGALLASARAANQPLSESDLVLLRDVAQQLGVALQAAQLTADLQTTRERLVIAREEERRRIRNDLHDELAPTLSSLQLQLGAMRSLIRRDPEQAERLATELRDDLRQATAEIRRLVYDLRPPMLDELGLVGAIRNFGGQDTGVHFEVTAPAPMPALPAAVEVAAYRIASEACHNVVKHAAATDCQVHIEVSDHHLTLSVSDNGQGMPVDRTGGVGVRSMRERAAELGGTLSIEASETGGTCLTARLPIGE
ncbi:MAG: sensor histidine kinase [Anaerolineae bacterium]|nr:sensor histidine kinase [Anaerolineae bacterium]